MKQNSFDVRAIVGLLSATLGLAALSTSTSSQTPPPPPKPTVKSSTTFHDKTKDTASECGAAGSGCTIIVWSDGRVRSYETPHPD